MRLRATTDRALVNAAGGSRRIVKVEVTAPEAETGSVRRPVNLSLVLDRSGSMSGAKLELAKKAALAAISLLSSSDTVSLVVYDDKITVALPAARMTPAVVREATAILEGVKPRGSTDLSGGWVSGCTQVARTLDENALGRVILLTDGLANQGVVDHDQIVSNARELRLRNVSTSTFGVGNDFDEGLLGRMAEAGGGNFHYIATPERIMAFVTQEVGEALEVTLPEARLVLEGLEGVEVESPNGYPVERRDGRWSVALGSLVSGQELSFLLDLRFPAGTVGRTVPSTLRIESRAAATQHPPQVLSWTFENEEALRGQPIDRPLRKERAELEAHRVHQDALQKNRRGETLESVKAILEGVQRIRRHALGDQEILAVAARLEAEAKDYEEVFSAPRTKAEVIARSYAMKGRDVKGGLRKTNRIDPGRDRIVVSMTPTTFDLLRATTDTAGFLADRGPCRIEVPRSTRVLDVPSVPQDETLGPLSRVEELLLAEAGAKANREVGASIGMVVTPRPLGDNWFSHWHAPESVAIVSTAGFSRVSTLDLRAFLAYEVLLHGLRGFGWQSEQNCHEETRGCLFDFCRTCSDIDMKLHVGEFCRDCKEALMRAGLFPSPAGEIAEAIHALAAATTASTPR